MRLLYIITKSEMGGSQTHLMQLMRNLCSKNEVFLATGEQGYLTDAAQQLSITVFVIPSLVQQLAPLRDLVAYREVRRLIRYLNPDLIHCHNSKAGVIGRLAGFSCGVPVIFTAHTWSFALGTPWLWRVVGTIFERLGASLSRAIITVSDANRNLALQRKIASPRKLYTIHNGIPDTIHQACPSRDGIPNVVMIARFVPQKNHAELLCAAAGLDLQYKIIFVGEGPTLPEVKRTAEQLGIADRVEFLGTRLDTEVILSKAQLFVLSTNWEGFPMTILEAMRAGLPVIATDVDGVREAVNHAETGFLYARGDIVALRRCLSELLSHPFLRAQFGRAGRAKYLFQFKCDSMVEKTTCLYHDVLASSACS